MFRKLTITGHYKNVITPTDDRCKTPAKPYLSSALSWSTLQSIRPVNTCSIDSWQTWCCIESVNRQYPMRDVTSTSSNQRWVRTRAEQVPVRWAELYFLLNSRQNKTIGHIPKTSEDNVIGKVTYYSTSLSRQLVCDQCSLLHELLIRMNIYLPFTTWYQWPIFHRISSQLYCFNRAIDNDRRP